jgi:hypothetical protein
MDVRKHRPFLIYTLQVKKFKTVIDLVTPSLHFIVQPWAVPGILWEIISFLMLYINLCCERSLITEITVITRIN